MDDWGGWQYPNEDYINMAHKMWVIGWSDLLLEMELKAIKIEEERFEDELIRNLKKMNK